MLGLEMHGTDIPNAGPGATLSALATPAAFPLVWPRGVSCCAPT